MPWQDVPGARGTQWRPASETLADPNYEIVHMPDGTIQARQKPGFWTKALPYMVGGAMGYGALSGAGLLPGLGAASGGGAAGAAGAGTTAGAAGAGASAATGGALASYGPSAAMQIAGASLPSVTASGVGAGAAAAGGGGLLSQIGQGALNQFRNDPLGSLGQLGDMLGSGARGAAEGRRADALAQATAGRVNLDALVTDQRRAALRSLLGGVQDARIDRPAGSTIPTFNVTGGLRPSALADKEGLMSELSRRAPTVDPAVAGWGEKAMGIGGGILGMLGSLGRLGGQQPTGTPPYDPRGRIPGTTPPYFPYPRNGEI